MWHWSQSPSRAQAWWPCCSWAWKKLWMRTKGDCMGIWKRPPRNLTPDLATCWSWRNRSHLHESLDSHAWLLKNADLQRAVLHVTDSVHLTCTVQSVPHISPKSWMPLHCSVRSSGLFLSHVRNKMPNARPNDRPVFNCLTLQLTDHRSLRAKRGGGSTQLVRETSVTMCRACATSSSDFGRGPWRWGSWPRHASFKGSVANWRCSICFNAISYCLFLVSQNDSLPLSVSGLIPNFL